MTTEGKSVDIKNLFARAAMHENDGVYRTEYEWRDWRSQRGVLYFKRRALGLCGTRTVMSMENVAQLLTQTGIAESVGEARRIVPYLANNSIPYRVDMFLEFTPVLNAQGTKAYRIESYGDEWKS